MVKVNLFAPPASGGTSVGSEDPFLGLRRDAPPSGRALDPTFTALCDLTSELAECQRPQASPSNEEGARHTLAHRRVAAGDVRIQKRSRRCFHDAI